MDKNNALKLALEAMEGVWNGGLPFHHVERMGKAIKAAKRALAAPVQEPVAWQGVHDQTDLYYRKPPQADVRPLYATPPAAPVQEPVKTGDTLFQQFMSEADKAGITHWPTPPAAQRQWVGLTNEEREHIIRNSMTPACVVIGTEAKLMEKNV